MTTDSAEALHERRGFAGLEYEPIAVEVHAYLDSRCADGYELSFRVPQGTAGQTPYDGQLRAIKALLNQPIFEPDGVDDGTHDHYRRDVSRALVLRPLLSDLLLPGEHL